MTFFDEDKVMKKEDYERLGVTPIELYYRQNGLCWLEIAFDDDGTGRVAGELYCTDGEQYERTGAMLNPTIECAKCMSNFTLERENYNMMINRIDRFVRNLLILIAGAALEKSDSDVELFMTRETFDVVEDYINSVTLSSKETSPIRLVDGDYITIFGSKVIFLDEVPTETILIEPGGKLIKVPYETKTY